MIPFGNGLFWESKRRKGVGVPWKVRKVLELGHGRPIGVFGRI